MKGILSPVNDDNFNEYLLNVVKARLLKRALFFNCEYSFDVNGKSKKFTANDVINTIKRKNNYIYFSNQKLIHYIVYDISQRFWYTEFNSINNILHKIYLEYRSQYDKSINKRKREMLDS